MNAAIMMYRAGAQLGSTDALYNLGICYSYGYGVKQSDEEAAKYFLAGANAGCDGCQFGDGVEEDADKAIEYLTRAAKQGNDDAMYSLGEFYENGIGVKEDLDEAVKYYKAAATEGNEDAIKKLKKRKFKRYI